MSLGTTIANAVNQDNRAKTDSGGSASEPLILRYPMDINAVDGRECMRFQIIDRLSLSDPKKSIYLYTPPGVSIPDSATYNQADLGILGGAIDTIAREAEADEVNVGKSIADITGALITKATEKSGAFGQAGLIQAGTTSNPFTNVAFQGTALRSFNFTFKMVAESEREAEEVRMIENTFRKFLYPTTQGTDFLLKYPPYFKIEFITIQGDNAGQNKFMPFINYCYLLNMTTTFNGATNIFHTDGQPTEVDLSLTFQETKALIRDDLYATGNDNATYANTQYKRKFQSPSNIPPQGAE